MNKAFWMDSNAIKTNAKVLKHAIKHQQETEKEIEQLEVRLKNIKWTEDTIEQRLALYNELGRIIDRYRKNRIRLKWYQERFLKHNITG